MEEFTLDIIARKSVRGIFALISRTFLIQILGIATSFILTVYLDPASFGVFFVVSSLIVFFNYFQDIGFAASLIQKKEEPTLLELQTTFTVQQILVTSLVVLGFLFSKNIGSFYRLDQAGLLLYDALLFSFFISSLKTIPTVLLERKLDFNKLVVPQIVENVVYNLLLIIFATGGFGVTSFTIAVLARGLSGLVVIYIVQPWKVGFAFRIDAFKKLVSFGLPFQTNSILALLKDDLINIYLGKVLQFREVGYVGFSQKWAFVPMRLVMDNVIKITFPSMSRLQHDKEGLKLAIEKSLFFVSFVIFPSVVGIILLSPYLVRLIPRYQKWEPALFSLAFFALHTVLSSLSTPLTNFLNAIGKIKITLYFMIFWTVATWVLTVALVRSLGFNGVAISAFVVSLSSIFVLFTARFFVPFSLTRPLIKQLIATFFMALFILLTKRIIINLPLLFFEIFFAGSFYIVVLFILARKELLKTVKFVAETIRSK